MSTNVNQCGTVKLGKECIIQDNVILGNSPDGVVEIGDNSIIRAGSIVYSNVKIGRGFRTGHFAMIRENTVIGEKCLVGTNSVLDGNCTIGNNVSIQTAAYITTGTVIEDDVFIGPRVCTTNDKYMYYGAKLAAPVIKKGARVGANSTILPGIVIGEGAVIGSGAVVVKDVPANGVVVGNPGRIIKMREAEKYGK
ncbi:MAG TPA: acyltransferase [Dehalococcoidales bacterium]|nr:acyltransferase [Dehalococcoidales bacterium]